MTWCGGSLQGQTVMQQWTGGTAWSHVTGAVSTLASTFYNMKYKESWVW